MIVYDQLKEIEAGMREVYKKGYNIPCTVFRDIELYESCLRSQNYEFESNSQKETM